MRTTNCALLAGVLLLAGCAGLQEKISGASAQTDERATRLLKTVGQVEAPAKPAPLVTYEDGLWLATTPVKLSKLPAVFQAPATFDRSVDSLAEFAERISLRAGMPARVTQQAVAIAAAQTGESPSRAAGQVPGQAPGNSMAVPPLALPSGASSAAGPRGAAQRIVYSQGTLQGLLDTVAARFGVFWKYAEGGIQFYYTESETFQISAIPGESALSASVATSSAGGESDSGGNGGSSNGGASGSSSNAHNSQNTAVKSQLSVFGSIEKTVTSMLSPHGKVVGSPATGSLTVVDTPDVLARVGQFIDGENKALARQVMLNVTVLAVTLSEDEHYGIDWNLVYGNLSNRYGIKNTFGSAAGSTAFSAAVLATSSSKFAGSSVMVEALSGQGKVRRETSASVVTLNNQPVPVQVAKQTSYLKSSQTTLTANIGASTTLTPGVITSGFNMTILPHLLSNGTVMLQFGTDISSLRRLDQVRSQNSMIQTPELDTRNFLQRVAMRSGETLVVSGFEQVADDLDRQGTGKPGNMLLGGGSKAHSAREIIVILITPIAMAGA
ncbi:PilN family type IVB pilus formation outer membrane protein [Massilia sp. BJB1822]|uniref:PilN family type IVB pilus formation outer membrane protein n=1 Tax=Massilia sp. BJB1822 TaxID=2744470 RepID=UPI001594611F|nr:PilN family type IVB pilus formation outer membrane protein [Massilia sp. BJB1822]NVE00133.1 PilN family type IVB pilus formation outer membrane protein [Massilia sp. BJB1822]